MTSSLSRRLFPAFILCLALAPVACTPAEAPVETAAPAETAAPVEPAAAADTMGWPEALAPAFSSLVPAAATIEILADGFKWSEGPVWVSAGGFLLFSDVPENTIHRWHDEHGLSTWLTPSGYTGTVPRGGEPGSNGLAIDGDGQLVLCQHGDRRIARLEMPQGASWEAPSASFTTLAGHYREQRFHSPNDLVIDSRGRIFFTDPPYGLEGGPDGPGREMDFQGVYRLDPDGTVHLLSDQLSRPNGIALSPDESMLYVANSDPEKALWMAWTLTPEGDLGDGGVFFDATAMVGEQRPGLPDGMAVDEHGHLFATGPGGVLVLDPGGTHLGTLRLPQPAANCAFGDDGKSLYITSDAHLLRVRTATRGAGFSG